jgi:methylmalonyl-CoA/ethylmalonyl-CoA epimerase
LESGGAGWQGRGRITRDATRQARRGAACSLRHSAPPNYDESRAAESRADFVHKLSVALKEMRETRGWLRFIVTSALLSQNKVSSVLDECEQLCRILGQSVLTAKRRAPRTKSSDARFPMPDARFQDSLFCGIDHIAIVVADTEEALRFYRDALGLPLLFSEVLEEQEVRLTHLDLGNAALQLVQPLKPVHPLNEFLKLHGEGLHHLCFNVESVPSAMGRCGSKACLRTTRSRVGVHAEDRRRSSIRGRPMACCWR